MDDYRCNASPCTCANYENKIFGDVILSFNSAKRLIPNNLPTINPSNRAYGMRRDEDLWTNHKIGGKYIVAYRIDRDLDKLTKSYIPQACNQFYKIQPLLISIEPRDYRPLVMHV